MKTRRGATGFTLLEVLFAILIFSVAVVALIQAINGMGEAAAASQRNRAVVARLDALVLELTRNPPPEIQQPFGSFEKSFTEEGVQYSAAIRPAELNNAEGAPLQGIFALKALARWDEGARRREMGAETLMYPPLYAAPR
jgi:prepilin-type N-terminal cleavage/methylation domain-containing protein